MPRLAGQTSDHAIFSPSQNLCNEGGELRTSCFDITLDDSMYRDDDLEPLQAAGRAGTFRVLFLVPGHKRCMLLNSFRKEAVYSFYCYCWDT